MQEFEIKLDKNFETMQIKTFLRKNYNISASTLTKLKQTPNGILKNGCPVKVIDSISASDVLVVNLPKDKNDISPVKGDLNILYEDDNIIAIDKPAGLPVHPVKVYQENTLANYLRYYNISNNNDYTFRAVNRLDKDTSGIVLVAKDRVSAAKLQNSPTTYKQYFAICEGIINTSGTVNLPIRLSDNSKIVRVAGLGGADSVTHYQPIKVLNNHTLLSIVLETGRTHQIRCHLSHIGHPLAGDDLYGGSRELIKRQALHCGRIVIIHPITQEKIEITSPIPKDFFLN